MKVSKIQLAIVSELIDHQDDEFTDKELKQRLKYLIQQNTKIYDIVEDNPELQYALGDTINILQFLIKSI